MKTESQMAPHWMYSALCTARSAVTVFKLCSALYREQETIWDTPRDSVRARVRLNPKKIIRDSSRAEDDEGK